MGYSELLLPQLAEEKPRSYVEKITASSKRAASLTRQLLAFGRRQMLMPRVLDLNAVVVESCRISSRLLGENIETVVLPMLEPAWIKADMAQIDQIIANLAANAHAAMPEGGKFTVAVSKITVDEKNMDEYAHLVMGNYVLLSVSDTGDGMAPEIKSRLFEPFFSTREFGKGTGLGLAAIYGSIIQSGGNVLVHSEPGHGSTFQIFLPSVQAPEEALANLQEDQGAKPIQGSETILLVEDQEPLLQLSCEFLEKAGYRVLIASLPEKAIAIAREFPGRINLLLTDILMPGMDGRELADKLREQRPSMKVLYVSGFVDRAFENARPLTSDEAFMEKPYGFEDLGRKIRELV
jgi:two-component system cell cycle sensor histidine kinase/response regulator CckA